MSDHSNQILNLAEEIIQRATRRNIKISVAESCTGGLLSAALTDISGASAVFEAGYITYSNIMKMKLLNVSCETLDAYGAVSEEAAFEMAEGALMKHPQEAISLSITGIAGPLGGSKEKPVGMVCFGLAKTGQKTQTMKYLFSEEFSNFGRLGVRQASVKTALSLIYDHL